jgi:hypothetical protein
VNSKKSGNCKIITPKKYKKFGLHSSDLLTSHEGNSSLSNVNNVDCRTLNTLHSRKPILFCPICFVASSILSLSYCFLWGLYLTFVTSSREFNTAERFGSRSSRNTTKCIQNIYKINNIRINTYHLIVPLPSKITKHAAYHKYHQLH